MPGMMNNYWGSWGFGGIIMILFWVIIIIGIIALVKLLLTSKPAEAQLKDTPLEILKRRYAQGEITKEEFEEKKRTLGLL